VTFAVACPALTGAALASGKPSRHCRLALARCCGTSFFAFCLVELGYLVTEEILVEACEIPDGLWVMAMFFAGFFALLVMRALMG